ncbi:MAG: right-handed parallel beta-helix repeat-containing protein [Candidatus Hydrogenedentota bacterium]
MSTARHRKFARMLLWGLSGMMALSAHGATFVVRDPQDLPDTNPGDGVAMSAAGTTTLRAAVEEANATPGADEIVLSRVLGEREVGAVVVDGPLFIADDLVITVEQLAYVFFRLPDELSFRVLEVMSNVSLQLYKIRFSARDGDTSFSADRGGLMFVHPGACVALEGCTLNRGRVSDAGGAIYVDFGTLDLRGASITGYSCVDGGGIYNRGGSVHFSLASSCGGTAERYGGGIFNDRGVVRFSWRSSNSAVYRSTAGVAGGGIYSNGGVVAMQSAFFRDCEAPHGAGLYLTGDAWAEVIGCNFREQVASADGGGIYVESGVLRASQTTIQSSSAGNLGGGVFVAAGEATLINCTLVGNDAQTGGGIAVAPGGTGILRMGNSVVAQNIADEGPSVYGVFESLGHNALGVSEGAVGLTASDFSGTVGAPLDPMLEFLVRHDGTPYSPGLVYVPGSGSPLIDAGDTALLAREDFVGSRCFDARLTCCPRVRGSAVDIGALEYQEGEIGLTCMGTHSADADEDGAISLSEMLRVIQLFNAAGFGCYEFSEDGYRVGAVDHECIPHSADYLPQDWRISLTELLRVIQFFNVGGYHHCPAAEPATEDGYCPGVQ